MSDNESPECHSKNDACIELHISPKASPLDDYMDLDYENEESFDVKIQNTESISNGTENASSDILKNDTNFTIPFSEIVSDANHDKPVSICETALCLNDSKNMEDGELIDDKELTVKEVSTELDDMEEGEIQDDSILDRKVCHFFQVGKCIYGNNCKFLHVTDKGLYSMFDRPKILNSAPLRILEPNIFYHSESLMRESMWDKALNEAKKRIRESKDRKDDILLDNFKSPYDNGYKNYNFSQRLVYSKVPPITKPYYESRYIRNTNLFGRNESRNKTFEKHNYRDTKCSQWHDPWRRSRSKSRKRQRTRSRSVSLSSVSSRTSCCSKKSCCCNRSFKSRSVSKERRSFSPRIRRSSSEHSEFSCCSSKSTCSSSPASETSLSSSKRNDRKVSYKRSSKSPTNRERSSKYRKKVTAFRSSGGSLSPKFKKSSGFKKRSFRQRRNSVSPKRERNSISPKNKKCSEITKARHKDNKSTVLNLSHLEQQRGFDIRVVRRFSRSKSKSPSPAIFKEKNLQTLFRSKSKSPSPAIFKEKNWQTLFRSKSKSPSPAIFKAKNLKTLLRSKSKSPSRAIFKARNLKTLFRSKSKSPSPAIFKAKNLKTFSRSKSKSSSPAFFKAKNLKTESKCSSDMSISDLSDSSLFVNRPEKSNKFDKKRPSVSEFQVKTFKPKSPEKTSSKAQTVRISQKTNAKSSELKSAKPRATDMLELMRYIGGQGISQSSSNQQNAGSKNKTDVPKSKIGSYLESTSSGDAENTHIKEEQSQKQTNVKPSKRELLLKQLRAVEEAIARKKGKL